MCTIYVNRLSYRKLPQFYIMYMHSYYLTTFFVLVQLEVQYVSSVDVTFNDITLTEIFEEGWVYDTLWVDEGCFVDGTGFPRCKIEGKNI